MKFGIRKPSIKKSISAKTTGKAKRSVNKNVSLSYGEKGTGYIKDYKRAINNKTYRKRTVGIKDLFK